MSLPDTTPAGSEPPERNNDSEDVSEEDSVANDATVAKTTTRPKEPTRSRRPPPAKFGYLAIDSNPYVTVYIDGKRAGITPIAKLRLRAGKHRVKTVRADGQSKRFRIKVPADGTLRRRVTW